LVIVFLFLQLEMEIDSLGLCVVENDLPLIQLRTVETTLVFGSYMRPDVVAVAARIVSQEGHRVDALRGEVVYRADEALELLDAADRRLAVEVADSKFAFGGVLHFVEGIRAFFDRNAFTVAQHRAEVGLLVLKHGLKFFELVWGHRLFPVVLLLIVSGELPSSGVPPWTWFLPGLKRPSLR